jgi:hypothetical protein
MKEKDLSLTDGELRQLAVELDKVRSTATTVRVPRGALAHIIADHSRMARELFVDRFHKESNSA